jgi:hypothetical protein
MDTLARLNAVNDVPIYSVEDPQFVSYGRIVKGFDIQAWISYMENETPIPSQGNIYLPSNNQMEQQPVCTAMSDSLYGGMPIQIGYCNGRNTTYNGFEYHKGSEINVAVTDFMLVLGHSYEIHDLSYDVSQAEVFFVKKGTVIEMYSTTLHLSPCRVNEEGFKDIIVLPRGTNTPLLEEEKKQKASGDPESKLLLLRNKWVIAHPKRKPLIDQGAYPGVTGENKELHY